MFGATNLAGLYHSTLLAFLQLQNLCICIPHLICSLIHFQPFFNYLININIILAYYHLLSFFLSLYIYGSNENKASCENVRANLIRPSKMIKDGKLRKIEKTYNDIFCNYNCLLETLDSGFMDN